MTPEQRTKLKEAVYAIADAHQTLKDLDQELKADRQWADQADLGRLVSNLDDLDESSLGYYLKKL